jgi:hypothetical protein
MTEPNPTPKLKRRYPRRKTSARVAAGLQGEIALLRAIISLLSDMAFEDRPLSEQLRIYDILGRQTTRVGMLVKAQRELEKRQDLDGTLQEALALVKQEMSQEDDLHKTEGFPQKAEGFLQIVEGSNG